MQAYKSNFLYMLRSQSQPSMMVMDCTNPLDARDPFYLSFDSYHYLIHYFLHLTVGSRLAHYQVHHDDHGRFRLLSSD